MTLLDPHGPAVHLMDADDPAATRPPVRRPRRLQVLVADPNPDAADSLATLLRLSGHAATAVTSGGAALRAAAGDPPDVVVFALNFLDCDGAALAAELRAGAAGRRPLLVATTARPHDAEGRRVAAGADEVLVKPFEPARLLGILRRFARLLG